MRTLLAGLLLSVPAWAGYSSNGTVTFPAATGSTQTNITLAFSFSASQMATVANGGQVTSTSARVIATVPNDVIFTSDSTCATLAGSYKWGYEDYSATTGAGHGWILIPSLSSSASQVVTVCVGNSAVTTYQGGAQGAEFDTNTKLAMHVPDGSTINVSDFSSGALTTANTSVAATTGQIDGGGLFSGAQSISVTGAALNFVGDFTLEMWVNAAVTTGPVLFNRGVSGVSGYYVGINTGKPYFLVGGSYIDTGAFTIATGGWHHLVWVMASAIGTVYVDGVSKVTGSLGTAASNPGPATIGMQAGMSFYSGSMDEIKASSTARGGNYIASEYANQLSAPALSALSSLSGAGSQSFIF